MKLVHETAAGKSISAYVILNPQGKHIATVRAYFADSGGVTVNVLDDKAGGIQEGRASGWGYDKFTAALSKMTIDGHAMANHCETNDPDTRALLGKYQSGEISESDLIAARPGHRLANYGHGLNGTAMNLYKEPGLGYLKALGYTVIQAI